MQLLIQYFGVAMIHGLSITGRPYRPDIHVSSLVDGKINEDEKKRNSQCKTHKNSSFMQILRSMVMRMLVVQTTVSLFK